MSSVAFLPIEAANGFRTLSNDEVSDELPHIQDHKL